MIHSNRAKLLNVPETRAACPFEYREDNATGKIMVEGYAATFDPYEVNGGPERGGWTEQLQRTAFDVTLATKPDLMLLINHEGLPLARTTSGTLQLARDRHGLKVRALLDPDDPDVQRLVPKLKPQPNGRSNMDEMSFGFRVKDQVWDNSYTYRTITELSLQHGDVSIVNYGANSNTAVAVADAVDALAQLSRDDLMELRDLIEVRAEDGDSKKPYGDVKYADPGYRDGVKRYPIDTEAHARAAWSYINQGKNRSFYSAEQLSAIEGRIKAALKKFGVDVSEHKKALPPLPISTPAPGITRTEQPPDDDDEIEPPGTEAFTPDNPTITVGQLQAAVSDAADPHGVRSLTKRLAEFETVAVSLPPTLAP